MMIHEEIDTMIDSAIEAIAEKEIMIEMTGTIEMIAAIEMTDSKIET